MATAYGTGKKYDVVEVLRRDYTGWSNKSDSKTDVRVAGRKLKTLPQATWNERDKVIAELKATLPYISPREVRRHCIPYHQAILLELEEQGFDEAADYLKELLNIDEKIAEERTGRLIREKSYLKDQKDYINCLQSQLIAFENAKIEDDCVTQATSFLDAALFFQSKSWEWWWLSERLYETALAIAEFIEDDDYRTITLIRYLYGRFLFYELQNPRKALDHLKKARETSERKTWNASKKLGIMQRSIFIECNVLLHEALLILAREERSENPDFALEASIEALERATDADNNEYLTKALYELGKSYMAKNDMKRALQSFSKLLALAKRIPDPETICNGHMELAFTYKQLNDDVHTEKHLRLCRENAEHFEFTEKLADAHYYTGEHYLSKGKLDLSTVHLETALSMYNKLGSSEEADRARCIAGISKGQERIKEYFNMLLQCGEYDENATLKICRWKSHRESFWIEETQKVKPDLDTSPENSLDTFSSLLSAKEYNN